MLYTILSNSSNSFFIVLFIKIAAAVAWGPHQRSGALGPGPVGPLGKMALLLTLYVDHGSFSHE